MSKNESYPPAFRRDGDASATVEEVEAAVDEDKDIKIPVIDLESLDKETLREACKEWGIFRLENHGVPLALTSRLQEISESLLSLPFEEKRELFAAVKSPLSYFWGTPALKPSGDALKRGTQASNVNMLEGFNVPLSSLSKLPASTSCDQPSKLESFRVLMEEYGRHITRIAVSLFEAIAQILNLELSGDQRSDYLSESTGLIRVYRYPRSSSYNESTEKALGMEIHTDSSVISILKEYDTGGLEIMKDEEWFSVKPVANTLVVNLGDMMQALSDDEYKSVKHRVRTQKNRKTERHSVCYFVFPEREYVINSSKYKPFTYSEFEAQVQADVQSLGTKIGLPRFTTNSSSYLSDRV